MKILLTIDLEEFDLPLEFGIQLRKSEQFKISKLGLDNLLKILDKYQIKATFFTTSAFASKYSKQIKQLSQKHEIACHGLSHSETCTLDSLKIAKTKIEKIINKKLSGFRAPRYNFKKIKELELLNFKYDSSIHPTWLPGRYCNILKKRTMHKIGNIIEIPPSTLPFCRLPIYWLAFKNFPLIYSIAFTKINFLFSDYIMLVFHPWEFTNLKKFKIPRYIKHPIIKKLEKYIRFCKKNNYQFTSISNYLQKSIK